jgi:hypothetical protein
MGPLREIFTYGILPLRTDASRRFQGFFSYGDLPLGVDTSRRYFVGLNWDSALLRKEYWKQYEYRRWQLPA